MVEENTVAKTVWIIPELSKLDVLMWDIMEVTNRTFYQEKFDDS